LGKLEQTEQDAGESGRGGAVAAAGGRREEREQERRMDGRVSRREDSEAPTGSGFGEKMGWAGCLVGDDDFSEGAVDG
jgi:hypothetical protein